jgi:hypothetical protein
MLKQIIVIIIRFFGRPSDRLSEDWRADELERYEHDADLRAGLYR